MSDVDFKPSGPPRPNTLYINWPLYKALGYVSHRTGKTREDLADIVLNAWLLGEHPDIMARVEQLEKDEQEFRRKLRPVPFE